LSRSHGGAYVFVLAPMGAGIAWFVNRHSPVGHIAVTVWSLFLAYAAAVMPAVLNPNSNRGEARHIAEVAKDGDIITLGTPRYYTINFYLDDRIRLVPDVAAASAYPVGTGPLGTSRCRYDRSLRILRL